MIDITSGLQPPTPADVRALRESTGLPLSRMSELLALGDRGKWSRWERGVHAIPLQTWALALLATGQHPRYRLCPVEQAPDTP